MICPRCGAVLPGNASRCFECGASVRMSMPEHERESALTGYVGSREEELEFNRRKKAREPLADYTGYQKVMMSLDLVLCGIIILIAIAAKKAVRSGKLGDLQSTVAAFSIPMLVIAVIMVIVGIKAIISVSKLQESNGNFATAFKFLIVGLVVSFLGNRLDGTDIGWLVSLASTLLDVGYLYYFCKGAAELCMPENRSLADRWSLSCKILVALQIISAVFLAYFELFVRKGGIDAAKLLMYSEILLLVGTLIDVVAYLYIIRNLNMTVNFLGSLGRLNSGENYRQ